jgi:hypothetical protein
MTTRDHPPLDRRINDEKIDSSAPTLPAITLVSAAMTHPSERLSLAS